jgi:hypothetical protein
MKASGWKEYILKTKKSNLLIYLLILVSPVLGCNPNEIPQNKGNGIMMVKVVSLEKCSATDPTISLVYEVAKKMGVEMEFEHLVVKTQEEARAHRHIGSPTVQINNLDIDPEARALNDFGIT